MYICIYIYTYIYIYIYISFDHRPLSRPPVLLRASGEGWVFIKGSAIQPYYDSNNNKTNDNNNNNSN